MSSFMQSAFGVRPTATGGALAWIALTLGAVPLFAQESGAAQVNPPVPPLGDAWEPIDPTAPVQPLSGGGGPEVIGPWTIVQAPSSAVLIEDGGFLWNWLNVVNVPVSIDEAFTGFSLIDDGFANGQSGTTVEMTFAPPVVNREGTDLVLFDGRFSLNSCALSTDFDGFADELALPFSEFASTGELRAYFYGGTGPFSATVMAGPVDLSDVGVPVGASVSAVRVIVTSTEGDLLGLGVNLPPCTTFDFETEDDFVTPLVNGQHLDVEFGSLVSITSSGANAGLAIFDSTVGGPNDPSQDPDLLVGTGNVLILQTENFPPDASGVFPRPNDDDDGGTISFAFAAPVTGSSLRLIDIDAGGATTVVLVDGDDRQRVYSVPSDWTGDIVLGQPGHGILDLTTLAGQPGFGSVATAAESPGFDPSAVVRIDVTLGGSGALDDLEVCFTNQSRAALSVRNAEENALSLASSTLPVLGSTWSAVLDCSAHGRGIATLVGRRRPSSGALTPFGEVLITGALVSADTRTFSAAASAFDWDIPYDLSLVGLDVHFQGMCSEAAGAPSGGKVRQMRGRLSNALDLVLGF